MATEGLKNGKKTAVLDALRKGNTRRAAAEAAGIHHATFYRWIEEDATLRDAVEKAEADAEQYFLDCVKSAAPENWQAGAWWLERRRHREYAKKDNLNLNVRDLDATIERELARLASSGEAETVGAASGAPRNGKH